MRIVRALCAFVTLSAALMAVTPAAAASFFAVPAFQQQWQQGESLTPNFWGPLATAHDGQLEPYAGATSGPICAPGQPCLTIAYTNMRTVQYFDKGRMELTNGNVTNGLLAREIVKGLIQTGDAAFTVQPPPAIPIAGDPDNPGPTYAALASKGMTLFDGAPMQLGGATQAIVSPAGDLSVGSMAPSAATTFIVYDETPRHNLPRAFAEYREKAGLLTIGLALSEPFFTTVKVAGAQKQVMVQVFERRVLTYTADNPDAFKVEMGNIGQHYFRWRYPNGAPNAPTRS